MALKIHICAVGRLRSGPERTLLDDYLDRFDKTGRALGLGPVKLHEVEDRKGGGMAGEAPLLRRAIPDGAVRVMLDERGTLMSSAFSGMNMPCSAMNASASSLLNSRRRTR